MTSLTSPMVGNDFGHARSHSAGVSSSTILPSPLTVSHLPTLHHRHSSSLQSMPSTKRVWVRRPGMQATTVTVNETDIVDDLKSLILQKYPTSLARTCDPADLVIELVYEDGVNDPSPSNINGSMSVDKLPPPPSRFRSQPTVATQSTTAPITTPSSATSTNPGPGNDSVTSITTASTASTASIASTSSIASTTVALGPQSSTNDHLTTPLTPASGHFRLSPNLSTIELQPDDSVFAILDHHFPEGMKMSDALLISFPAANERNTGANSRPFYQQDNLSPQPRTVVRPPPTANPTSNSSEDLTSPHVANNPNRPPIKASKSTSSVGSNSSTKSSRQEGSNGVLLLPRQFKLPNSTNNDNGKKKMPRTESAPSTSASSSISTMSRPGGQQPPQEYNISAGASNPNRSLRRTMPNNFPILEGVVPQINVLIVEDNVINQKILEAFMRRKRIRCSVAKNGKEAVEKWRQGGFHLVLMDIQLPVMSGIDATKEIRRLEQDNRVGTFSSEQRINWVAPKKEDRIETKLFKSPVIIVALTASSSNADKSVALAAGCNDFLTKPVNLLWLEQKTIEWGCMQALIDFEGWKHWMPRPADDSGRSKQQSKSYRRDRSHSRSQSQNQPRSGIKTSLQRMKNSSTPVNNGSSNQSNSNVASGVGSNGALSSNASSSSKRYHPPPSIIVGVPAIVPPPAIVSPARPEHEPRSESQTPPPGSSYDSRDQGRALSDPIV
ncbi:mitogen-activated protein kinase kinase kinase SSK1 [Sugiyamaella lignohabitans]|uniref:Mitogen-activated protein kinase kinase kinase SSK1 n=1 Tax=Sugiyamaella lignohabitans TaxID=796027 RepID=A0A167FLK9_9ASCO|nr:mitogen-activated protein kinase kinase kinase SSK1 [Sugiyamaella lignohabitans]ANB15455.1 mitogen-activated protein kinase kinase kinase SSK1 [Sugiyamaella lignohabitans]